MSSAIIYQQNHFPYVHHLNIDISSVQSLSCVQLLTTLWTAACQASLSITNSRSLLKLMSIESMMPSTISSSVVPFSSCPQSLPASGSFPMSWLFASGGQSIGASASALPMKVGIIKLFLQVKKLRLREVKSFFIDT